MSTTPPVEKQYKSSSRLLSLERQRRSQFNQSFLELDATCVAAAPELALHRRDRKNILANATLLIRMQQRELEELRKALGITARPVVNYEAKSRSAAPSVSRKSSRSSASAEPSSTSIPPGFDSGSNTSTPSFSSGPSPIASATNGQSLSHSHSQTSSSQMTAGQLQMSMCMPDPALDPTKTLSFSAPHPPDLSFPGSHHAVGPAAILGISASPSTITVSNTPSSINVAASVPLHYGSPHLQSFASINTRSLPDHLSINPFTQQPMPNSSLFDFFRRGSESQFLQPTTEFNVNSMAMSFPMTHAPQAPHQHQMTMGTPGQHGAQKQGYSLTPQQLHQQQQQQQQQQQLLLFASLSQNAGASPQTSLYESQLLSLSAQQRRSTSGLSLASQPSLGSDSLSMSLSGSSGSLHQLSSVSSDSASSMSLPQSLSTSSLPLPKIEPLSASSAQSLSSKHMSYM